MLQLPQEGALQTRVLGPRAVVKRARVRSGARGTKGTLPRLRRPQRRGFPSRSSVPTSPAPPGVSQWAQAPHASSTIPGHRGTYLCTASASYHIGIFVCATTAEDKKAFYAIGTGDVPNGESSTSILLKDVLRAPEMGAINRISESHRETPATQ